jgi:hypothetical protein
MRDLEGKKRCQYSCLQSGPTVDSKQTVPEYTHTCTYRYHIVRWVTLVACALFGELFTYV